MSLHEIVLPETKPETEWVRGRALQKVSPRFSHARAQGLLFTALDAWACAGHHGRVGTEWRFRIAPANEIVRPLVPDVAYLSYTAQPADATDEAVQIPLGSPTVAFEVLSPGDRRKDVEDKIATYLRAGSAAVVIVNTSAGEIVVRDAGGARLLREGDTLTHPALPGFALDLRAFFVAVRR